MRNHTAFQGYIDKAVEACQKSSFQEKGNGIWTKPKVVEYYAKLPDDAVNLYLTDSLRSILPDTYKRHILIVGGAVGRLGRKIAQVYPNMHVTDIDSSESMVSIANKLAAEQNLDGRFKSEIGNGFNIRYEEGTFDYVMAQGFIRYFSLEEQVRLFEEMKRVTKKGVSIGEGKAKDAICALQNAIPEETEVIETAMPMFRMSLFFMLLKMYERDEGFQKLIQENRKGSEYLATLSELAGTSDGIFYELRMK